VCVCVSSSTEAMAIVVAMLLYMGIAAVYAVASGADSRAVLDALAHTHASFREVRANCLGARIPSLTL
jgi:hypothetical protein